MTATKKSALALTAMVLATALSAGTCLAQTNWAGGIHFNGGFPTGQLDDQIQSNAYGIGGQFFYSPQKSPFAIGLELNWMNYGSDTRSEPFSTTIPDVVVDVETENNIAQAFLVLRGQTPAGPIRLYGDALLGVNYLFTETTIKDNDFLDDVASSTNQDDAAFAYGVGGGAMIPLYTRDGSDDHKSLQVLLDGGLRYVKGGEAEYLKKGSIRREDGIVAFDPIKSETDLLKLHVGVVIRF